MNQIRVAIVIPTHWSFMMGGAQYQLKQITERLLAMPGVEVVVLAKRFGEGFSEARYTIVSTDSGLPIRAAHGTLLDSVVLWRALDRVRPDVIYQRVGGAYTGVCGIFSQLRACPFVWHVAHDYDVTRRCFAGEGPRPVVWAEKRMLELGLRRASRIICQSEQQVLNLRKSYGRTNSILIRNASMIPDDVSVKSDVVHVVWIANFKRWKHPEVFISLARRFADHDGIEFVMAGRPSGDVIWQSSLEEDIKSTANLEYLGELTQEEVNALLARSDIFVNTSVAEGFPNTFIQAWMRRVPVVSFGFDPDGVLAEESVGFAAGTTEELYEAVYRLAYDKALRGRFAKAARDLACRRHGPSNFQEIADVIVSTALKHVP